MCQFVKLLDTDPCCRSVYLFLFSFAASFTLQTERRGFVVLHLLRVVFRSTCSCQLQLMYVTQCYDIMISYRRNIWFHCYDYRRDFVISSTVHCGYKMLHFVRWLVSQLPKCKPNPITPEPLERANHSKFEYLADHVRNCSRILKTL